MGTTIIPILQIRKLMHRKVKSFAQGHTARPWEGFKSRCLSPGSSSQHYIVPALPEKAPQNPRRTFISSEFPHYLVSSPAKHIIANTALIMANLAVHLLGIKSTHIQAVLFTKTVQMVAHILLHYLSLQKHKKKIF